MSARSSAAAGGLFLQRVFEDHGDFGSATALVGVAAAGGFNEKLAHGAGGDAFEMELAGGAEVAEI